MRTLLQVAVVEASGTAASRTTVGCRAALREEAAEAPRKEEREARRGPRSHLKAAARSAQRVEVEAEEEEVALRTRAMAAVLPSR